MVVVVCVDVAFVKLLPHTGPVHEAMVETDRVADFFAHEGFSLAICVRERLIHHDSPLPARGSGGRYTCSPAVIPGG